VIAKLERDGQTRHYLRQIPPTNDAGIGDCKHCPEDVRRARGCPVSRGTPWTASAEGPGYAGQANDRQPWIRKQGDLKGGADEEPWSRMCPRYFRGSPFFVGIMSELPCWEAGRLGDINRMPAPLVTYLRIASAEKDAWLGYQQESA